MKLVRQSEYKIVNDDGTDLMPFEEKNVRKLMGEFIQAKVLGESSPVSELVALRMAQVVYKNYYVAPKDEATNISNQ